MIKLKVVSLLSLFLSFFIFISFLYHGLTIPPPLGDSHDYHIPIAQNFLSGSFLVIPETANPYINFPGSSEIILAVFILLHLPLNWFCLLGWVVLFFLLRKLGMHFGLGGELAIIYATAFTSTLSVLRQIATQSIDMWMAVWFVLILLFLEKPQKKLTYFLILGILFGMLVGSKGSGIIFMAILLVIYGIRLLKIISLARFVVFLLPFLLLGASWYVRNFIAWGNPMYPIKFFIFPGVDVQISQFLLWQEILRGHGLSNLEALVSEYLLWGLSFIPFLFLFMKDLIKRFTDTTTRRVFLLTFLLFLSSFLFSFKPGFVSNMRYFFPVIIMMMLSLFMLAKKYRLTWEISLLAILNSIAAVSYIIYHPKAIIIYLALTWIIYIKKRSFIENFIAAKS